ncbi:hypothetical protein HYX70_01500 [Candidatus Saccharibacteria bacterium]|nr:hypothetical protein [Candidatus Saccharibacteria bacterium]
MNEVQLENLSLPLRRGRVLVRFQKWAGVVSIRLYTECVIGGKTLVAEVQSLGVRVDRGGVQLLSKEYDLDRATHEWRPEWQTSAEIVCLVNGIEQQLWHPTVLIHIATLSGRLMERRDYVDRESDIYMILKTFGTRIEALLARGSKKWEPIFADN